MKIIEMGGNSVVLSESAIKSSYLKANKIDRDQDCAANNSINGYGEGSHMVFGLTARRREGNLFKLYFNGVSGGISTIAHEFSHMFHINRGIANIKLPSKSEAEMFSKEGISVLDHNNDPIKTEELNAVIFENRVSEEIHKKTNMKTTKRTKY